MVRLNKDAYRKIFDRVLADIKPSDAEAADITYRVNELTEILAGIVPKNVELRVAGSIARGTNLKGNGDVDIFLLFDKSVGREKAVRLGLEYGKKVLQSKKGHYEIKYAEHPYVRLYVDSLGMKADIVPALKIDNINEMGTTVDRTPLHTEFINSHLTSMQKDHVRLLKYLLRSYGIYGAEVKTNGFSGYLCELLIHHYGSIQDLMSSAVKFRLPMVIEPRQRNESNSKETASRFNSQFVVIDPVDPDRNVAAGVSLESLSKFVLVARKFVQKPDIKLFHGIGFSQAQARGMVKKLSDSGLDTFLLLSRVPDKSEDVIYPQLRKVNGQISKCLQQEGFSVYFSAQIISGRVGAIFMAAPKQRLVSRLLKGPTVFIPDASDAFIKKHRNALGFPIIDSEIYALEKARLQSVEDRSRSLPRSVLVHKDINLSKMRLLVNKVPKEYSVLLYSELQKKFL
jgi:tRNA nucleotidyltransferase (CCA-adding enzyme)